MLKLIINLDCYQNISLIQKWKLHSIILELSRCTKINAILFNFSIEWIFTINLIDRYNFMIKCSIYHELSPRWLIMRSYFHDLVQFEINLVKCIKRMFILTFNSHQMLTDYFTSQTSDILFMNNLYFNIYLLLVKTFGFIENIIFLITDFVG